MRRAARVDKTQGEIVDALRASGVSVFITPVGNSFPDLACAYRGYTALVECKSPGCKTRPGQSSFALNWQGTVILAYSGEEAVAKFFEAWAVDRMGCLWMDQATEIEA